VTRVIAPLAGGYLLQHLGLWAPGIFSVILMGWTIVLVYRRILRLQTMSRQQKRQFDDAAIWWIRRDLRLGDNQLYTPPWLSQMWCSGIHP